MDTPKVCPSVVVVTLLLALLAGVAQAAGADLWDGAKWLLALLL